MDLKRFFINQAGRVRSGWRVAAFILSTIATTAVGILAVFPIISLFDDGGERPGLALYIAQFSVGAVAALFFGWMFGRIFEDLPFSALGASFRGHWFRDLAIGCVVGAVSLVLAAGIVFAFGSVSFAANSESTTSAIASTLGTTLALFIFGAAFEEAFFRGYMFQTLGRERLWLFGAAFTAIFFATIHNGNPGASPLSWLNTFIAGIWLAVAYWKTRNLWFPFGIHLAWNWVQGSILGINVSGLESLTPDPLLRARISGPDWISGGGYGVEASIACTIALIVSTVAIVFLPGPDKAKQEPGLDSPERADGVGLS